MPRSARVVLPGYLHHVTQRGNYRQNVFTGDNDRIQYLKYVNKYCREYGVKIFAYCLMNNHVHLIVEPQARESLARAFNLAHQRYSCFFHRRNKISGHLWQGRFYSCALHGDHVSGAARYVEKNPVRAGIVKRPWDYSWSSARAHLGKEYKIIRLNDIREHMDVDSWKEYLMEEEEETDLKELRDNTTRGGVIGPEDFVKHLEKGLKRSLSPRPRGRRKIIGDSHQLSGGC